MENETEFQNIGKKLPYKTPEGFFEHLSETNLLKSKQRLSVRKRTLFVWRTLGVAASLIGIALIGFYVNEKVEPERIVADTADLKDSVIQVHEIVKQEETTYNPSAAEKLTEVSGTTYQVSLDEEKLSDILADLTDEELQQMAAMYRTDPFMEGIQQ